MKKFIFGILVVFIICRVLAYFVYTDVKVWIFHFNDNYNIDYVDRHNTHIIIPVDSADYHRYTLKENRKKMYKLRIYEDGKINVLEN